MSSWVSTFHVTDAEPLFAKLAEVVETVGAEFLTNSARPLTPADEDELRRLGWRSPSEHSPNWHRVFVDPWPWPAPLAAEMTARTLFAVHHAHDEVLSISAQPADSTTRVSACEASCSATS